MELRELLVAEMADVHRMIGASLTDLTPEIAHWEPGGTANTIAGLLAHTVFAEDNAINRVLKAGQSLFERDGWAAKTGIPTGRGAIWTKGWTLELAAFNAYRTAVQESADAWIATYEPAALDREVEWFGGPRSGASLLRGVIITHALGHAGEISALKGIQGLNGLPL